MTLTPIERRELLIRLGDYLQTLEGQTIRILESLCIDAGRAWDRHCTLHNDFCFKVIKTGWQMSGGHIYLFGGERQYGFFSGHVTQFELAAGKAQIYEELSPTILRKTHISIQSK
jgi:hypothetical protein